MSISTIITIVAVVFAVLVTVFIIQRRIPRRLKVDQYIGDWKELQSYCKDKKTWPDAVLEADKLLNKALKRRKFKGKSMGERMVSAQRKISDNDRMWFAHNLAKKIISDPKFKLKEADVKNALIGFRQALKDIGALKTIETPIAENVEEKNGK